MSAQYTAYIKDLVDYDGNIIYPRTKVEAIYDNDGNVLSIPKNFIINVTEGDPPSLGIQSITIDKTYAEILEAYNMGYTLSVVYSIYRLPLAVIQDGIFLFMLDMGTTAVMVQFSENHAIGQKTYLMPIPSASDAGKILMVGDDGNAVWTAITNAEGVAY